MLKPRIGYSTRNYPLDPLPMAVNLCIRLAGGIPVRIHPDSPKYDDNLYGLVIGGGADLSPTLFNFEPKPGYPYDTPRDTMEFTWLELAEARNLPVLGICRGAQTINVYRGGSLHMDVSKAYDEAIYPSHLLANISFRKMIVLQPGTKLRALLSMETAMVNSLHKQAVNRLGKDLVISAREKNGVIQAIEDPEREFYMGVQFHPETLVYRKEFRRLFKTLVGVARDRAISSAAHASNKET